MRKGVRILGCITSPAFATAVAGTNNMTQDTQTPQRLCNAQYGPHKIGNTWTTSFYCDKPFGHLEDRHESGFPEARFTWFVSPDPTIGQVLTEQTPQPEKNYNYKQTQAIHMQWQMRELREGVKRATLEELAQIPMHETPDIFMPEGFWRACSCCDVMNTVLYSTYGGFAFCALCIGKAAGL